MDFGGNPRPFQFTEGTSLTPTYLVLWAEVSRSLSVWGQPPLQSKFHSYWEVSRGKGATPSLAWHTWYGISLCVLSLFQWTYLSFELRVKDINVKCYYWTMSVNCHHFVFLLFAFLAIFYVPTIILSFVFLSCFGYVFSYLNPKNWFQYSMQCWLGRKKYLSQFAPWKVFFSFSLNYDRMAEALLCTVN